jgi:hypothetical protein
MIGVDRPFRGRLPQVAPDNPKALFRSAVGAHAPADPRLHHHSTIAITPAPIPAAITQARHHPSTLLPPSESTTPPHTHTPSYFPL